MGSGGRNDNNQYSRYEKRYDELIKSVPQRAFSMDDRNYFVQHVNSDLN